MTSGSKYGIVDQRLLRCLGLFQRLLNDEVDGTKEGSLSHFLAGPTSLHFYVFVVVSAAGLASPLLLPGAHR
jgi:hypothetical protein